MLDIILNLIGIRNAKDITEFNDITGFIPAFEDIEEFKKRHKLTCKAKTLNELVRYLEMYHDETWIVFKSARERGRILNLGSRKDFPTIDDALGWLWKFGGGKYVVKASSLGNCKLGYYKFEGEDKFP